MLRFRALMTLALLLSLCIGKDTGLTVTPDIRSLNAIYSVPLPIDASAELRSIATFPLTDYTLDLSDEESGIATMSYTLPELLFGREHTVAMQLVSKSGNQRSFAGTEASATCEGPWTTMLCRISLLVKPDLSKLESILTERQDPNKDLRLEVARRFSNDPIGITQVIP